MSNALLRLPALEPTTTTVRPGVAPSNPPPKGSCWRHNGETIMVADTQPSGTDSGYLRPGEAIPPPPPPTIALIRGVDGDARSHVAAFWKQVEVYEP